MVYTGLNEANVSPFTKPETVVAAAKALVEIAASPYACVVAAMPATVIVALFTVNVPVGGLAANT